MDVTTWLEHSEVTERHRETSRPYHVGLGAFPAIYPSGGNSVESLEAWVTEAKAKLRDPGFFKDAEKQTRYGTAVNLIGAEVQKLRGLNPESARIRADSLVATWADEMAGLEADLEAASSATAYTQQTNTNKPAWFSSLDEALKAVQQGMIGYTNVQQQLMAQQLLQRQAQGQQNYVPQHVDTPSAPARKWPWEDWTTGTKVAVGLGIGFLGAAFLVAIFGGGKKAPAAATSPVVVLPPPAAPLALPAPK